MSSSEAELRFRSGLDCLSGRLDGRWALRHELITGDSG